MSFKKCTNSPKRIRSLLVVLCYHTHVLLFLSLLPALPPRPPTSPSRSLLISLVPSSLHWLSVACQKPVRAPAVRHTLLPLMTSDDTRRWSHPLEMTGDSVSLLLWNCFFCSVCGAPQDTFKPNFALLIYRQFVFHLASLWNPNI